MYVTNTTDSNNSDNCVNFTDLNTTYVYNNITKKCTKNEKILI